MRKAATAMILVLLSTAPVWAAAPDTLWTRTFGGASYEWAWYVEETSDLGYVVTGHTRSTTHGDMDIYIVKLNQDGSLAWESTYGVEEYDDEGGSAKETADGNLIVGGYRAGGFGAEGANFYMMELGPLGNFLWDANYDYDTTTDYGYDICQTLDGGYVMVGSSYYYSESQGKYDWGINIVRTDAAGTKQHHVLVDRPGIQHLNRVIPTADSGAVAIGTAGALYIVKIDKYGDTTWIKGYGGVGAGWSILQLEDGGYVAFGDRAFNPPEDEDFWLLRLNSSGDTLWSRRYPNVAPDLGYGLDQTNDGGFIMAGEMYRNGGVDPTDFYLIRTDANGDTLWTKTVGGEFYERSYCVKQTSDGGYIVCGRTDSFGAGSDDFYIVKLGPDIPLDVTDGVEDPLPEFRLLANYPNPFNPSTTIEYRLGRRAEVKIEVINLVGQTVRTLIHETQSAGDHRIVWNGVDEEGRPVSTGVYLYRLTAGEVVQTKKMVLVK